MVYYGFGPATIWCGAAFTCCRFSQKKENSLETLIVIFETFHQSVLSDCMNGKNFENSSFDGKFSILESLSNSVFERRTSTGSGLFASLGSGLVQSLGQIVFIRERKLSNTNLLESRPTSSPGLFPQKMGGAGKGPGIGWSRVSSYTLKSWV